MYAFIRCLCVCLLHMQSCPKAVSVDNDDACRHNDVIQSMSHTSILRLIVLFIYHVDDLNTRYRSNVLFPI